MKKPIIAVRKKHPPIATSCQCQQTEDETQKKEFVENVWFLIENAQTDILQTPEIGMAAIPYQSGSTITGSFTPTLGGLVLWWTRSELGCVHDAEGRYREYALCMLAGSTLSGVNNCLAVDREGNRLTVHVQGFMAHLRELAKTDKAYKEKYPDVAALCFSDALARLKEKTEEDRKEEA